MPKNVYKIEGFHGGINDNSDPRDIKQDEFVEVTNLMVDKVGLIRTMGSVVNHSDAPAIDGNAYGSAFTQVSGSGFFFFSHDRRGAQARYANSVGASFVAESGDSYLCLYDDSAGTSSVGPSVFIYTLNGDVWSDVWEDTDQGPIQFLGKSTGAVARPCFYSVDGVLRVSTGEFKTYDSGSDINDASHFLSTDTTLTVDNGAHFLVGNYLKIEDEIIYVKSKATHDLTVIRGLFGTKIVQHDNNKDIFIINMNQWYGYINENFFQTNAGDSAYKTHKWYNNIQHLRSLDNLGVTMELYDANSSSPTSSQINVVNKIIVAYWFTATESDSGFWNGSYWIGLTPVYEGNQEGPISTVGSSPLQIHEEILNVQLYITHPDLDDSSITESDGHPLIDERIIGVRLYTKAYTSDEWFLLKEFDLLEGGEHGWETYNSDAGANITSAGGNTLAGYWKTTSTADSLSLATQSDTESYDGQAEDNTCVATLNLEESKGANRVGTLRLLGFQNSPLYQEVDLSSTSAQAKTFNVINPSPGLHKFSVELLDENFNIMRRAENEVTITDSGVILFTDLNKSDGYGGSS